MLYIKMITYMKHCEASFLTFRQDSSTFSSRHYYYSKLTGFFHLILIASYTFYFYYYTFILFLYFILFYFIILQLDWFYFIQEVYQNFMSYTRVVLQPTTFIVGCNYFNIRLMSIGCFCSSVFILYKLGQFIIQLRHL